MKLRRTQESLKRLADIIVAGGGLVIAAPLIAVVASAVRFNLGSPVFFRQRRPGKNGRPFTLVKFRTMRAPRAGEELGSSDADRLTVFGQRLRSWSLDELPTLWNVLRGDMSLVGPRPLLMRYLPRYTPQQARRHEVRPGITGWAQVHGRNALTWEEKFTLDVWYVDHWSLVVDAKILWQTVFQVLSRRGIGHADHVTMKEFIGEGTHEG